MVVELVGVGKRFAGHWAVAHVDLQIEAGTCLLLTGSNGAGKTTLLRLVATALRPTLGTVQLFGSASKTRDDGTRTRVSLLTHTSHLYDDLSARENLSLVRDLVPGRGMAVHDALGRVGLQDAADRAPRTFSAGMKRRLGLARVLVKNPELVLLDEPFGQLDPEGVGLMEGVIGEFKDRGATLIVSTHDIERGLRLADARLTMERGQPLGPVETLSGAA